VDSRTLLQVAIAAGGLRVVGLLLDNGADPFAMDKWGQTALHCAVATGDPRNVVRRFVFQTLNICSGSVPPAWSCLVRTLLSPIPRAALFLLPFFFPCLFFLLLLLLLLLLLFLLFLLFSSTCPVD